MCRNRSTSAWSITAIYRLRSQYHRGMPAEPPAVRAADGRRAGAAVLRCLGRPMRLPGAARGRRQERLRERAAYQVAPEIHQQEALVRRVLREEADRKGFRADDAAIHVG